MKGNIVTHQKFGRGKIVKEVKGYITVAFENMGEVKTFKYPDSFDKFLVFENAKLQEEAVKKFCIIETQREEEEAGRRAKYAEIAAEQANEKLELLKKKRKVAKAKIEREKKQRLKLKEKEES